MYFVGDQAIIDPSLTQVNIMCDNIQYFLRNHDVIGRVPTERFSQPGAKLLLVFVNAILKIFKLLAVILKREQRWLLKR